MIVKVWLAELLRIYRAGDRRTDFLPDLLDDIDNILVRVVLSGATNTPVGVSSTSYCGTKVRFVTLAPWIRSIR